MAGKQVADLHRRRAVRVAGRSAGLVATLVLLASCGVTGDQAKAVTEFGSSASTLASGIKATYAQAADDVAQLYSEQFVIPTPGIAARVHAGQFATTESFYGPFLPQNIQGRTKAAAALGAYGTALTTLIDAKTQNADFSAAVTKLTGALKSIPATTLTEAGITTKQIDGVGSVLVALGEAYLDWKRRQTLEAVVPAASPVVGKLCALFASDFDPAKANNFADKYLEAAFDNAGGARRALEQSPGNLESRAVLMPIYRHARLLLDRGPTLFKPLQNAADDCVKSNAALAAAIADPKVSFDDIAAFVKQADAAYTAVQATIGK